jgi:hypothetical protein
MRLVWVGLLAACAAGPSVSGCRCGVTAPARGLRPPVNPALATPAVLATLPEEATGEAGTPTMGLGLHGPVPASEIQFQFGARGGGVAYGFERAGRSQVFHNGRPGKEYDGVGAIAVSPDGRRCAYGARVGEAWHMVVDGVEESRGHASIQAPLFSPDGAHLAYQALDGERRYLVVDGVASGGTTTRYRGYGFSADGTRLAFITDADDRDRGKLVVSDLGFKDQTVIDASASGLRVSEDASAVAAIASSGGKQQVVSVRFERPGDVRRGAPGDAVSGLVFGPGGSGPAYVMQRAGERYVVLADREEPLAEGEPQGLPAVADDGRSLGLLVASSGGVGLRRFFGESGPAGASYEEAEGLVAGADGTYAFAARRADGWFVVVGGHEGPVFDRVVTPTFSPDGRYVVYRARKEGRRFVVVAGLDGKTVRQHPYYDQVFPVRFTADGRSVGYGVKDGRQLAWKVEPL